MNDNERPAILRDQPYDHGRVNGGPTNTPGPSSKTAGSSFASCCCPNRCRALVPEIERTVREHGLSRLSRDAFLTSMSHLYESERLIAECLVLPRGPLFFSPKHS